MVSLSLEEIAQILGLLDVESVLYRHLYAIFVTWRKDQLGQPPTF